MSIAHNIINARELLTLAEDQYQLAASDAQALRTFPLLITACRNLLAVASEQQAAIERLQDTTPSAKEVRKAEEIEREEALLRKPQPAGVKAGPFDV